MWPKVIAQLFELMPHITRLVPMAERFFASRANERPGETAAAVAAATEGIRADLRADLGEMTKAQAGVERQMQEHALKLDEIAEELKATRLALEKREQSVQGLEEKLEGLSLWLKVGSGVMVVLMVAIVVLVLRVH